MDFQQTYLPESQIYREAFKAGWTHYLIQHDRNADLAEQAYLKGPVAMARLIQEHGGDVRQIAAAACLAGPAVFSEHPAQWLDKRLVEFSREIRGVGTTPPQRAARRNARSRPGSPAAWYSGTSRPAATGSPSEPIPPRVSTQTQAVA